MKIETDDDIVNFIENYNLKDESKYIKCMSVIYWVCTTFTTVGFGDFYP